MASVSKRGESYQVKWRQDGRQQAQSFKSHREAREFKASIEADVYRGTAVTPDARDMTMGQWWDYWMETRTVRASTLVTSRMLGSKHILPTFGRTPLAKVTQVQVQAWMKDLELSPASKRRVYAELRGCLSKAVQAGYLYVSPCRGIALPKVTKKTMRILDHAEIEALATKVPERYQTLVYFLAYSGLRIGEALALTPASVTSKGVQVAYTVTRDERAKELIGETKTDAGHRFVPLPKAVLDRLAQHMETYPGDYVFTTETGKRVSYRNFNVRVFGPVSGDLVIHDLRHTAITHWIRAGVDLPRIAAWAGHTTPAFTLAQYAGYFPNDTEDLMKALDKGIQGKKKGKAGSKGTTKAKASKKG